MPLIATSTSRPSSRQVTRLAAQRRGQTQDFEGGGAQVLAHAAHAVEGAGQDGLDPFEAFAREGPVVQVEREQVELSTQRDQRLDRLVVQVAREAGALFGGGKLARPGGEASVIDRLGKLGGQALNIGHVVGGEGVGPLAFDVQDADHARAQLEGHVELGAGALAPRAGDVARLPRDVVDQEGSTVARDPARETAPERDAEGARQAAFGRDRRRPGAAAWRRADRGG